MFVAGFALCVASAEAQTADPAAPATSADEEVVYVTGSRIARSGFDASTPVLVIGAEEVTLSGTTNIETLLTASPQFVAEFNGGPTSNNVPGGNAQVDLRGLGPQRNLVLVNGRRFAIQGPDQTTDLNTIPSALIARTEVVTGGSSAVYGSDAITGVVNFIIRDDFDGVEASYQQSWDSPTETPTKDLNLTVGGDFADGRGNAVVSIGYLSRGSIKRADRGDWAQYQLDERCVTPQSWSATAPGTLFPGNPSLSACRAAGGIPGMVSGGSGDIPNTRISGLPGANATYTPLYAAAGLGGLTSFGATFDDNGDVRPAVDPTDRYNLGLENYLQIPQERWMLNAFSTYDFNEHVEGYMEFHFSNNTVEMQLAPSNIGADHLLNTNNPYLSPEMQAVLVQMDADQPVSSVPTGPVTRVNNPNDGFARVTIGKRFQQAGDRFNSSERVAWRTAVGFRGDLGDVSEGFLHDLYYDAYYTYARTNTTDLQNGSISRSRFAAALLRNGAADPVCNIFGQSMSAACVTAIAINSTNVTHTEMQGAVASISGALFDLPAGPVDFAFGAEWREATAKYTPDTFLSSGDVAGFNAGLPTEGSESVREVFGEVRAPILSDIPVFDSLALNGAFRYSDYDLAGVGGVWTYSYGVDWSVVEDLTLRAQFQHALRAPNVGELFGGNATNFANLTDPCGAVSTNQTAQVRAVCEATGVPSANVFTGAVQVSSSDLIGYVTGGNPAVGPEESDTFTAGAVVRPSFIPGLVASVDYYSIEIEDAIGVFGGGPGGVLDLCYNVLQDAGGTACQAVNRNPDGRIIAPYLISLTNANVGAFETSGIDFAASYEIDLPWHLFNGANGLRFDTNWTYVDNLQTTAVQELPATTTSSCLGAFGPTCQEPTPEWKGVSRITWDAGPLSLSLRHRFVGESVDDRYLLPKRRGQNVDLANFVNPEIDPYHYFDLSFTLDATETVRFYGGVNNIADKDPPVLAGGAQRANTWAGTYDTNGRFIFLGATLRFQ
jgi:outer membrane receptor protein involved in Fe transport